MDKELIEKLMVLVYNIVLLAGASYLFVNYNVSGWIFVLVLIFAGSWTNKKRGEVDV